MFSIERIEVCVIPSIAFWVNAVSTISYFKLLIDDHRIKFHLFFFFILEDLYKFPESFWEFLAVIPLVKVLFFPVLWKPIVGRWRFIFWLIGEFCGFFFSIKWVWFWFWKVQNIVTVNNFLTIFISLFPDTGKRYRAIRMCSSRLFFFFSLSFFSSSTLCRINFSSRFSILVVHFLP